MSPDDFAREMRYKSRKTDTEAAHGDMDDLMCNLLRELGYGEAVDVFENAVKWYA